MASSSPLLEQTRIPLPPNPVEKPPDHGLPIASVPIHIVTAANELPAEFLTPSPEKQSVIGFDCEGVNLCRHGSLCIILVAFPDAIYLVDALTGGETLMKACQPALESSYITKALNFQFGIKLNNVVDTQQEGKKRLPGDYISLVGLLADPRYCDNITADGSDAPEEEILSILDVPPGKMGRVIGRKGASITSVKESCSAEILTGGPKGPPNKVFIIGPVKQVQKAEALLRGKMLDL
ncbi:hypothetical protein CDL15_Pgr017468 [Punica granatum]|uniref:K Homology domain-containing protein n=1 Tax=Punica granatum TaxID=22663 RepID=A0A218W6B3_PUNGR|nr:hypothetical protein CDL15_Pgr017468 [Punica granatum]